MTCHFYSKHFSMGNNAGKENDIKNLIHVCIVKDADIPKAVVAKANASG